MMWEPVLFERVFTNNGGPALSAWKPVCEQRSVQKLLENYKKSKKKKQRRRLKNQFMVKTRRRKRESCITCSKTCV